MNQKREKERLDLEEKKTGRKERDEQSKLLVDGHDYQYYDRAILKRMASIEIKVIEDDVSKRGRERQTETERQREGEGGGR